MTHPCVPMQYHVVIEHDPQTGHYTATVPGIPGIVVDAMTETDAVALAKEAIVFHRDEVTGVLLPDSTPSLRARVVTVDV